MRQRYPDDQFVWAMGADNLPHFHLWDGWQDIIENHPIILFGRPGSNNPEIQNCPVVLFAQEKGLVIENAKDIKARRKGFFFGSNQLLDISSTAIKTALAENRDACPSGLLPTQYKYRGCRRLAWGLSYGYGYRTL